jgi:hypothetical protein
MENESQNLANDRRNIYLEYALFLILGFLLGIIIKTEAGKRVTIGFDDYQVDTKTEVYNLNEIQKKLIDENAGVESGENPAESGGAADVEPEETEGTEDQKIGN